MFLNDTHLWTYVTEDLSETLRKAQGMNNNRQITEHKVFQLWQIIYKFQIWKLLKFDKQNHYFLDAVYFTNITKVSFDIAMYATKKNLSKVTRVDLSELFKITELAHVPKIGKFE